MTFLKELKQRSLLAQITHEDELTKHLEQPQTAYLGIDPTAPSLHIGHLLPVMVLSRWQKAGHRALVVMGGGTALIGDPSGKTKMRQLLLEDEIATNIIKIKKQLTPLLDFSSPTKAKICNNADWLLPLEYLPFLRDIGRHFSVNKMLTAECFRQRLETGLSFLEFNYMLLQSYDFLHLAREEDCTVQLGGDDQWSNMLSGVDLVRRLLQRQAFCVTNPLLTTSDGRKMGKTEQGAVWLDPELTKPFEYFQYWRNLPDDMVGTCLRYFTFLPFEEILELEKLRDNKINEAKIRLAFEATKIIHGEDEARNARTSAQKLFASGADAGEPDNVPSFEISSQQLAANPQIMDVLVAAGVFASKGEVRRLIDQGGLIMAESKVLDPHAKIPESLWTAKDGILFRKGKKYYYRLRIKD